MQEKLWKSLRDMEKLIKLSADEPFSFNCHNKVSCFNECCRDLNQFLTPYDVLRLKNHLNMTSSRFLKQYTLRHLGPETRLPVVTLKPGDMDTLTCPFISPTGCRVYTDRPSSCRMYPIIRMLSRSRENGKINIRYALLRESHCLGFEQNRSISVRQWVENQGLVPYNEMNDLMVEIISLKNRLIPGYLNGEAEALFVAICYDLDRFKEDISSGRFDINVPESVLADDEMLLRFGMAYLRDTIFAASDTD